MDAKAIKLGMMLTYGLDHPRTVEVIGVPFERSGRMMVLCEYATGYTVEAPLTLLFPLKKRPSARRVALKDVVKVFNELAPEFEITEERVADALKKHGVG